jgi:hypothetical protein
MCPYCVCLEILSAEDLQGEETPTAHFGIEPMSLESISNDVEFAVFHLNSISPNC